MGQGNGGTYPGAGVSEACLQALGFGEGGGVREGLAVFPEANLQASAFLRYLEGSRTLPFYLSACTAPTVNLLDLRLCVIKSDGVNPEGNKVGRNQI